MASYKTGVGCGDTVAIEAATGEYDSTRSAVSSENVVPVSSNDRVGTVSTDRIDLWRSDMVRTVEYGDVEAKQEPDKQPHEDCTISSALTRTENLALTESCPDKPGTTWLRFQDTTPDDSREPDIAADVDIATDGARLVAVGQRPPPSTAQARIPRSSPMTIRAKSWTLLRQSSLQILTQVLPHSPRQPRTCHTI